MRALGRSMRNLAMVSIYVRVHGLNGAACLVAEVKCALVLPLRLTGKTAVDAKLLALIGHWLKATETASCGHKVLFFRQMHAFHVTHLCELRMLTQAAADLALFMQFVKCVVRAPRTTVAVMFDHLLGPVTRHVDWILDDHANHNTLADKRAVILVHCADRLIAVEALTLLRHRTHCLAGDGKGLFLHSLISSKFLPNLTGCEHREVQRLMIHKLLLLGLPIVLKAHEIIIVPRGTFNPHTSARVAWQRPCNHSPINALVGLFAEKGIQELAALNRESFAAWGETIEEECVGGHLMHPSI